ncbi:hypothetical protein TUBRATIS_11210 [Tubulinosema ratisbonensis]|uniref:Uncharacterized protein n=1 Tax=Tubulinosema ratisbonensis TaxID=291195 RepID=A0A437AMF6_9MICR|nr:hypothetical protein TUBRATIS_11210 [Tubulinosema ratisbonensis]
MVESDPTLALFIMDLRSKSKEEIEKIILKHKKDMAIYNSTIGQTAYDYYLRTFFLIANSYEVNEIDFVRAIGSPDINVKRIGYLGGSFIKDTSLYISMLNTIKNDLESENILDALTFLGNIQFIDQEYQILTNKLKELIIANKFKREALVVYYKIINCVSRMNLSEPNESIFFVKLQILIDKLNNQPSKEDLEFLKNEKEINNVIYFLQRSKKFYIKTKCVQFLNILFENNIQIDKNILKFVEESIVIIRLLKKTFGEVAYYVECVDFLLKNKITSQKIQTFLFKMLQSGNEYFVSVAVRLAKKYEIYTDIALEKLIALGLDTDDNFDLLISMINQSNFEKIYEKREEIIMSLEGKDVSQEEIQAKINKLINKYLNFCSTNAVSEVFLSFPLYSLQKNVGKFLIQNHALKIYEDLKEKESSEYFSLLYQCALISNKIHEMNYFTLLKHLQIVKEEIKKDYQFYLKDTLNFIITLLFYKKEQLKNTQEILIQIYKQIYKLNEEIQSILIENILLFNVYLKEKTLFMGDDLFLEYFYSQNKLKISVVKDVNELEVYQNNKNLTVHSHKESNGMSVYEFIINNNNDLRVEVVLKNYKYTNIITNIY